MNKVIENDKIIIENMIYEIIGKQVMLDSDLAKLYRVETKRINEAVKNNPEKFPERFSWKLTEEESKIFWTKFSTKKYKQEVEDIKVHEYLQSRVLLCLQPY